MSDATDFLTLLRRVTMEGKVPVPDGDEVVLDGVRFSLSAPTTILAKQGAATTTTAGGSSSSSANTYYTVGSILFFLQVRKADNLKDYYRLAIHNKMPFVASEKQDAIYRYLTGATSTLDPLLGGSGATSASVSAAASTGGGGTGAGEADETATDSGAARDGGGRISSSASVTGDGSSSNKRHKSNATADKDNASVVASVAGTVRSKMTEKKPPTSVSGGTSKRVSASAATRQQEESDGITRILNREMKYVDRVTVLEAPQSYSLSDVLDTEREAKKKIVAGGVVVEPSEEKQTVVSGLPIIVIPNGLSATITMYNVKKFLEEGIFESTSSLIESGMEKPTDVKVVREHPTGGPITYHVEDSVLKFDEKHFNRVVAFFVESNDWQFKGWIWNRDPTVIFSKCAGVYVYYDDIKISPLVHSWNVKCFNLSRQQRHLDLLQCNRIWEWINSSLVLKHEAFYKAISKHNATKKAEREKQLLLQQQQQKQQQQQQQQQQSLLEDSQQADE